MDKIILVPAFHPPLSDPLTGADPSRRLEMLRRAFCNSPFIETDDRELKRKGASYSYRTVETLAKNPRFRELFFIMGLDQFLILDRWKNVPRILKHTHLIVTSRPGFSFPKIPGELPAVIRPAVKSSSPEKIVLKPPFRNIYFCRLKDREISSSLIKTRLKNRQTIAHLVPPAVDHYIKTQGLYGISPLTGIPPEPDLPGFCKKELESKQAFNVQIFDLSRKSLPFSAGLLASSLHPRHARALSRHLRKKIRDTFHFQPLSREGEKSGRWIVLDYNELVIHIFYDYERDFYKIDKLWGTLPEQSSVKKS